MFLPLFHLSVFLINTFTLWYDYNYVNFPFKKEIWDANLPFKNRILMLTLWGLTLQTIFFGIAFMNDILGSNVRTPKKTPILRLIKDSVFSVAFPLALYVSLAFWGLYIIDKDLILPDVIEKELPSWTNHVMHTTVSVFIFIELLFAPRTFPSRKVAVSLVTIFVTAYLLCLNYSFTKTGTFMYPVLDVLPWPGRIVFFGLSALLAVGICIFGEKLDSFVNPKKETVKQKKR